MRLEAARRMSSLETSRVTRLLIHVDGQTEESFINEVLAPHLFSFGYVEVSARIIGSARLRTRRGGIISWPTARTGILNHLREDPRCLVSTMVDYYGLPQTGTSAWPGRQTAARAAFSDKARSVEDALLADVAKHMGGDFHSNRFVPHVMMHEFEAMLFSDCVAFSRGIGYPSLERQFQAVRDAFKTPEEIDDSPKSAPSKRVQSLVPDYNKPLLGTLAALEIGLDSIRRECPHFQGWLHRLESGPVPRSDDAQTGPYRATK